MDYVFCESDGFLLQGNDQPLQGKCVWMNSDFETPFGTQTNSGTLITMLFSVSAEVASPTR